MSPPVLETVSTKPDSTKPSLGEPNLDTGRAILAAASMFVVHAVLAYAARTQYFQPVSLLIVLRDALPSIPVFFVLQRFLPLKTGGRKLGGVVAGCLAGAHIVRAANTEGYYAGMARAPQLGTLWVWLLLELEWYAGAFTLISVYAYMRFMGYTF